MVVMARAVDTIEQRLFTVEEYHRMAEAGILSPDERVELIRGVIHAMSPKKRPHVVAVTGALKLLEKALEGRASVYPEAPLVLTDLDSEPEPDVMVCSNPDFRASGTEATRALLVVEIADSSRSRDLGVKVALYAEAGVPEYWGGRSCRAPSRGVSRPEGWGLPVTLDSGFGRARVPGLVAGHRHRRGRAAPRPDASLATAGTQACTEASEPLTQESAVRSPRGSSFTSASVGPIGRNRQPMAFGVFSQQRMASIMGPRWR